MDLNHPERTRPIDERALYSNSGSEVKEEESTRIPGSEVKKDETTKTPGSTRVTGPLPTFPPLEHLSTRGSPAHKKTAGPPLAQNSSRVRRPDILIHNNTEQPSARYSNQTPFPPEKITHQPSARYSSQARFPPARITQQPWSDSSSEYSSSEDEDPILYVSKYERFLKKSHRPSLRHATTTQVIDDPTLMPPKKPTSPKPHAVVQYPHRRGRDDKPGQAYHNSKALPRGREVRQDYERRPWLRRTTHYGSGSPATVIVDSPGETRAQKFYKDQIGFLSGREREIREKEGRERGSSTTQAVQTESEHSNGEIRLRVDASAPLSLSFNGDMEGRTLQINPAEDGLADIIISGPGVKDEKNARSESGFLQPIDDYSQGLSHSSEPIFSTPQSASTRPPIVYQNESRRRLNTLHRPMNFAHEAQDQPPPPAEQVKARKGSNKMQPVEVASQTGQTAFPSHENNFLDVSPAEPQTVFPDGPPPFPPETKPTQGQTELPRGHILEKQTEKSPGDPESIQDDLSSFESEPAKIVPPNARWTKIDRRLVNPQALEEAKERFEERLDCVIVLRVLTKVEIQTLANRTRDIREMREANGKSCSRSSTLR